MLCTIVGVLLIVGTVVSIPVFTDAITYVLLQEELASAQAQTRFSPYTLIIYFPAPARTKPSYENVHTLARHIGATLANEAALSLRQLDYNIQTARVVLRTPNVTTRYGAPHTHISNIELDVFPGIAPHLTWEQGTPMTAITAPPAAGETEPLPVWLHADLAAEIGAQPGDIFEYYDPWRRVAIPVWLAGTWRATDPTGTFWYLDPDVDLRTSLLIRPEDYVETVEPLLVKQSGIVTWRVEIDATSFSPARLRQHAEGLRRGLELVSRYIPYHATEPLLLTALDAAVARNTRLTALLFVMSLPVLGFLLYFIVLLATITVRTQRHETAILVSRGMRRRQHVTIALVESLAMLALSLPPGALLGLGLARLMGNVDSFLVFTRCPSLPVSLASADVPVLAGVCVLMLLARLGPALRTSSSVITHEHARARAPHRPWWQRAYVDILLFVPVVYAYRRLRNTGALLLTVPSGDSVLGRDPLLFLVPALFMLACVLLAVRLFPLLMHLADALGAWSRWTPVYLAFRQLARNSDRYANALLLIASALGLGAFMASLALSLDQWLFDRTAYAIGADVYLDQEPNPDPEMAGSITEGAWALPVSAFREIPGIRDAARVGRYPATLHIAGRPWPTPATFLAVDRVDVPRLLFFRPDFADVSLGELMNQLAVAENAVLVSESWLAQQPFGTGDTFRLSVDVAEDVTQVLDVRIAGTYRYFPTVYESQDAGITVIGNLDFLFRQLGAPVLHDLWLDLEPGADRDALQKAIRRLGVHVEAWHDVEADVAKVRAQGERRGMFGTLTIGFLAAASLAGVGLLVFNYAALQARLFRFALLRALGTSRRQIVGQVSLEYLVLLLYSVVNGTLIGVWAARLFIPFFQTTDRNLLQPPALTPRIAWARIGWMIAAFAGTLILAQILVLAATLRRGVFQALRIGDRE